MVGAAGPGPDSAGPPRPGAVRSAVFWSYLLTAGRVGTVTVVTFVLAALLGPDEFGVLAMAMLVLLLGQILVQQGLAVAIIQREELTGDHLDAAFVAMLLGGVALGGVMALVSPLWALAVGEPRLTAVCLALAPMVPVHALMIIPEAVLRRALRFRAIAVRTVLGALAGGAVGIALALAGAGVWALVAQQVVTGVVGVVVVWAACPWRPSRRPRIGALRDLWRFSGHSANAALAVFVSRRADQLIASLLFGPVAVGMYRLAIRLPEMLVEVTARSLQQVALPALSRLQADRARFAARLSELQHLAAVVALPLLGVLAAAAEPLVTLLGPQWAGTELPLAVLCLYGATQVYGVVLGPALQAIGHPGRLAAIAWADGAVGAVVFLAVGGAVTGAAPDRQAAAIALAAVGVKVVVVATAVRVTRATVGVARLRLLAPTLPAVAAAAAAVAVPWGLDRLAGSGWPGPADLATPARLALHLAVAGLAGAAVLWAGDRRLRALAADQLRRVRSRTGAGAR